MNKPLLPPTLPIPELAPAAAAKPQALVRQPAPVRRAAQRAAIAPTPMDRAAQRAAIAPLPPAQRPGSAPYVDPYLFETGYYASRAEHDELTRTAPARLRLRADAEPARPKRRA